MPDLNEYTQQGLSNKSSEPDATTNIQNCYYCSNLSCGCDNSKEYIEKLVKAITKEVIEKLNI